MTMSHAKQEEDNATVGRYGARRSEAEASCMARIL